MYPCFLVNYHVNYHWQWTFDLLQEFESQENNLDNILEQFEKEQAQEFGKPRQPKPGT